MNTKELHMQECHALMQRNVPSQPLQMYLDARPVMSKCAWFPTEESRPHAQVSIQRPRYNMRTMFNPGSSHVAPWSGFATQVQTETELRGYPSSSSSSSSTSSTSVFNPACSRQVYVPSSQSSLYVNSCAPTPTPTTLLAFQTFDKYTRPFDHADQVGFMVFHNATRQQHKTIGAAME